MKRFPCLFGLVLCCAFSTYAFGQTSDERLNALEKAVKDQQKTIEEQQKTIDGLKNEGAKPPEQKTPEEAQLSSKVSGFFGGNILTNPNISLLLDTFVYTSNLNNNELANRGIPGFTTLGKDARNGFNLGAAEDGGELFIFAPVDPYFNLYANIPFTDEGVVLEEIFAVTTALPEGFQAKVGKFKSNFSRLDAQHPHQWDFF